MVRFDMELFLRFLAAEDEDFAFLIVANSVCHEFVLPLSHIRVFPSWNRFKNLMINEIVSSSEWWFFVPPVELEMDKATIIL